MSFLERLLAGGWTLEKVPHVCVSASPWLGRLLDGASMQLPRKGIFQPFLDHVAGGHKGVREGLVTSLRPPRPFGLQLGWDLQMCP